MEPNQTVLITGAAGRVGSLVVPLLKDQYSLRLTDLRSRQIAGLDVVPADLTDLNSILEVFKNCSAVVHMAIADYTDMMTDNKESVRVMYRQRMIDVNIRGTYHVYEAARILKIPHVVYISSITAILGDPEKHLKGYATTLYPHPCDFYAVTKLFGEQTARTYHDAYGIRSHILRLGQPCPLYTRDNSPHTVKLSHSPYLVSYADIARAISGALQTTSPTYGIYNVVSRTPHEYQVDCNNGREIGFTPQDFIDADFRVISGSGKATIN